MKFREKFPGDSYNYPNCVKNFPKRGCTGQS